MFLDNLVRHRKPQTAAFCLTAGEERIKNMIEVLFGNAYSRITHFNLDEVPNRRRPSAVNLSG